MKKGFWIFSTLLVFTLLISACGTQGAAVVVQPTAAPTQPPTSSGTVVSLAQNDHFGSFLVDDKGMSLYLFTKDTPNTTVCYDQCATNWPPLLTTGAPVASGGVEATKLGTTQRSDGTTQVTYNGWPLYYYIKDTKAGDTTGQDVGDVWFLLTPSGDMVVTPSSGGAIVNLSQNDMLGSFLVDEKGMTLYLFTKDTPNTTVCYDQCAVNWPPLLTTGDPVAGEGVDASKLGTTERTDGTMMVTYNGWPLYYYVKDSQPGDVTGQEVGDVWYIVSPAGEKVEVASTGTGTGAEIKIAQNDALGTFLVDDEGMTLYIFTKDMPNTSNCYDQCATNWPPFLTTGEPRASKGVDDSLIGMIERTDGTMQVTYNGWPLYYYINDTQVGDTLGQNLGEVWFVVSPAGEMIVSN